MAFRSLVFALALTAVAHATQVMHRPTDYKTLLKPYVHVVPPHNVTERAPLESPLRERVLVDAPLRKRAGGKLSVGYFTNWLASKLISSMS
jgi:hypothetical protein